MLIECTVNFSYGAGDRDIMVSEGMVEVAGQAIVIHGDDTQR